MLSTHMLHCTPGQVLLQRHPQGLKVLVVGCREGSRVVLSLSVPPAQSAGSKQGGLLASLPRCSEGMGHHGASWHVLQASISCTESEEHVERAGAKEAGGDSSLHLHLPTRHPPVIVNAGLKLGVSPTMERPHPPL
jgi:hypothetical protein